MENGSNCLTPALNVLRQDLAGAEQAEAEPVVTIELEEMGIIIRVPEESVSVTVTAHVMSDDGNIIKVQKQLSPSELRQARADFLDEVVLGDDYDAEFVLNNKGLDYAEQLSVTEDGEFEWTENENM